MSLVGTLHQCPEPCPDWLHQLRPTFDRSAFFSSRTVYYPGSGDDGQPVKLCAQAHAAPRVCLRGLWRLEVDHQRPFELDWWRRVSRLHRRA